MAWKKQYTTRDVEVECDVDDFTNEQLLQGLINAKWLSEDEAEAIRKRGATREAISTFPGDMDTEEFIEARHCILIGRRDEALIHLERFLGRDFIGRLA